MVTVESEGERLRRWLRKQGCTFVEESRHTRIVLGSKISRMPRHPAREIKTGTLQSILKDLDLKMWRGNREGPQWKITKDCSNPTGRLAATP